MLRRLAARATRPGTRPVHEPRVTLALTARRPSLTILRPALVLAQLWRRGGRGQPGVGAIERVHLV